MAPRAETPLTEHRRLRLVLRHARENLHLTQKEVAEALDWSPSKLIRIEKGSVGISITDLKALLLHYRVTDTDEVDRMVAMARASKKSSWWQQYRDLYPQDFITFLGLEASAIRIRQFQGLLVPGLLQSTEYIRQLMTLSNPGAPRLRAGLEIRLKRQELISDSGPEIFAIIDESVLYRQIGDNAVMHEQLLKLKELARNPRISVQILPYTAGAHRGMKGSFQVMELSNEPNDYALLLEQPYKDQLIEVPSDETREFVEIFAELEKIALPAAETARRLDERLKEIEQER